MPLVARVLAENSLAPSAGIVSRLHSADAQLCSLIAETQLEMTDDVRHALLNSLLRRLTSLCRRLTARNGGTVADSSSVLGARLLDRLILQWLTNVGTLWQRLAADRATIAREFGIDIERVINVQVGLGDPHAGGHTVCRVEVEGGAALIYKPRPVALEAFVSRLLTWLSDDALAFRGLEVLDRSSYGFIRALQQRPCATQAELTQFHQRLGGLLALAFVFGATDLHEDNLLAAGEHPVLIDLETLVTPKLSQSNSLTQLAYSVFDVGLLPAWLASADGRAVLSGGIGGGLCDSHSDIPNAIHLPRFAGAAIAPFAFTDDIVHGFLRTWRQISKHKPELMRLCESIRDATYRCVVRPTQEYWQALLHALEHADQQHETGLKLALARSLAPHSNVGSAPKAVFEQELESLTQLDIPYFVGKLSQKTMHSFGSSRAVAQLLECPWETFTRRLDTLSDDSAENQVHRIKAALVAASHSSESTSAMNSRRRSDQRAKPLAANEYLARACEIGKTLETAALATERGDVVWLQPRFWSGPRRWQLTHTTLRLRDGQAGIALFFSALARASGELRYEMLCERSISLLVDASSLDSADASIIYALTASAQLLGRSDWLNEAVRMARLLADEPNELDVASGAAGYILALLALSAALPTDERARSLSERAQGIAQRVIADFQNPIWARRGFTFGADGVRHAIARLGLKSPNRQESTPFFFDGAGRACETAEHDSPSGVCHGWLGLALSESVDIESLAHAKDLLAREPELALDHLCCGNAAIIDSMLEFGKRGCMPLLEASRKRAATLASRVATIEDYRLRLAPGMLRPGLFDGLAGIGYMWLRQHDPRLPCVTLWEPVQP